MFKHPPNHALSNLWKLNDLVQESFTPKEIIEVMNRALSNVKKSISQNKNRERYSQDRIKHPFVLGSLVYLQNHFLSNKGNKYQAKMDLRFSGPYEIIYFLNPVTVLIQKVQDKKEIKRVSISQLKLG